MLAPGWEALESADGTYYFNEATGETSWDFPAAPAAGLAPAFRTPHPHQNCFDNTHPPPQDRCRRDGRSSTTRRTGCRTISMRAQEKRSGSALPPMRPPPHLLLPLPRPLRPTSPLRPPRPPRPRRRPCLPQCRLQRRQALRACRLRCRQALRACHRALLLRLQRRQALRACHRALLRCRPCRHQRRQALRACHLALHLACPLPHRRLCRQGRRREAGVARRQT